MLRRYMAGADLSPVWCEKYLPTLWKHLYSVAKHVFFQGNLDTMLWLTIFVPGYNFQTLGLVINKMLTITLALDIASPVGKACVE